MEYFAKMTVKYVKFAIYVCMYVKPYDPGTVASIKNGLIIFTFTLAECGINAHKHCKDLVVMECRPKTHALLHGRSSSLGNGGKDPVIRYIWYIHIDGLAQKRRNSIALALTPRDDIPPSWKRNSTVLTFLIHLLCIILYTNKTVTWLRTRPLPILWKSLCAAVTFV